MFHAILNIRIKQLLRNLKDLGLIRVIVVFCIFGFSFYLLYKWIFESSRSWEAIGIFFLVISSIHFSRKDLAFIRHFPKKSVWLFMEYFMLSLPILSLLVFHTDIIEALVLIIGICILSELQLNIIKTLGHKGFMKYENTNKKSIYDIFRKDFEWIHGIRKNGIIFIIIYLVFIPLSFYGFSLPIAIALTGLTTASFYLLAEPWQMLAAYSKDPAKLLFEKCFSFFIYFSILTAPLVMASLIISIEYWYVVIYALGISYSTNIIAIILKYAFYQPNKDLGRNAILIYLNAACSFLPFFWPFPLIIFFVFRSKAISNLKYFLYD